MKHYEVKIKRIAVAYVDAETLADAGVQALDESDYIDWGLLSKEIVSITEVDEDDIP